MRKLLFVLIAGGLLTGCRSIYVNSERADDVDFGSLQTYTWKLDPKQQPAESSLPYGMVASNVCESANDVLNAKGYCEVTGTTDADVFVEFVLTFRMRADRSAQDVGIAGDVDDGDRGRPSSAVRYSQGKGWGVDLADDVDFYEVAILRIRAYDPASGRTCWTGTSKCSVDPSGTVQSKIDLIRKSVTRVMKRFPRR